MLRKNVAMLRESLLSMVSSSAPIRAGELHLADGADVRFRLDEDRCVSLAQLPKLVSAWRSVRPSRKSWSSRAREDLASPLREPVRRLTRAQPRLLSWLSRNGRSMDLAFRRKGSSRLIPSTDSCTRLRLGIEHLTSFLNMFIGGISREKNFFNDPLKNLNTCNHARMPSLVLLTMLINIREFEKIGDIPCGGEGFDVMRGDEEGSQIPLPPRTDIHERVRCTFSPSGQQPPFARSRLSGRPIAEGSRISRYWVPFCQDSPQKQEATTDWACCTLQPTRLLGRKSGVLPREPRGSPCCGVSFG